MERVNLFFLHGFLGRPTDWEAVKAALPKSDRLTIYTPDYFKEKNLNPNHNFTSWAQNFNRWVQMETNGTDRNVLVGYSLGGRLALHALEQKPALWYKTILISTNPGFNDPLKAFDPSSEDRRLRWMNDSYWAEEFLKSSWETLLRNWNAQPVFGGGEEEPQRIEKEYSREALGLALTNWSLAQQKNMRPLLQELSSKICFAVGERDEKFVALAEQLRRDIGNLRVELIPEASHRVLFDRPKDLAEKIKSLIQQLL
ncbi:alpha/beta fold hydrolase [Bdellovibrio svalbardensis]|uniref:Alpha/beta fold hydrolase n=1 Tax=Bdellovibrio svalbardensis TaxID=2972972 RepID=A0ABT6DFN6_9BACT|nr:alpha/beta fold hydrolase [Bdellovibrio svalbardensis]MDG0815282.1 alpha/beta fold hydrolase [Bdellovibrio svalbardensis]